MTASGAHPVFGLQGAGVILGDQRKHRLPFVHDLPAQDRGHRALAVHVDHQHLVTIQGGGHRQMGAGGGLARAALEIGHGDDLGGQAFGPVGQVFLLRRAFGGEMGAQAKHLFQREPFGPGFAFALGQVLMGAQHAAQMGGGDRDQVFGDFPQRKSPQAFLAVRRIAAPGQIIAPLGAKGRGLGKARGIDLRPEFRGGAGRVKVVIGLGRDRLGLLAHAALCLLRSHVSWDVR